MFCLGLGHQKAPTETNVSCTSWLDLTNLYWHIYVANVKKGSVRKEDQGSTSGSLINFTGWPWASHCFWRVELHVRKMHSRMMCFQAQFGSAPWFMWWRFLGLPLGYIPNLTQWQSPGELLFSSLVNCVVVNTGSLLHKVLKVRVRGAIWELWDKNIIHDLNH